MAGAVDPTKRRVIELRAPWSASVCCLSVEPGDEPALATARTVVEEMGGAILAVGCDMDSFQGFKAEVDGLPGKYSPEAGGALFLAVRGAAGAWEGRADVPLDACVGCIAIRRVPDEAGGKAPTAEIKRLFVRPGDARGTRLGRGLSFAILEQARAMGYERVVLDSLERLPHAVRLYESLGFRSCAAYVHNPEADAVFFEAEVADVLAAAE